MPSKRLAIVGCSESKCSTIRAAIHSQNGSARLLPKARYRGASDSLCFLPFASTHSPMFVQLSGYPCRRSHSSQRGVSRLTTVLTSSISSPPSIIICWSCIQFSARAFFESFNWAVCPFPMLHIACLRCLLICHLYASQLSVCLR